MLVATPIKDRVVVKSDQGGGMTPGGIALPDTVQDKPGQGRVIAVGPDVKEVGDGDNVYFSPYDTIPIEIDDQKLLVMKEEAILVKV